ncbi:hypothetical protein E3T23_02735 [Cryobacterium cheniae]|uniref:Uncharacterized protein n=1 Tax=Cryobacterium cheniae TaxID=1259262 RepID=A0A4R8XZA4_9MICO|nr:hypothetical protein [Cryobacterium cheniae]TFC83302.1 hypothetical protein E3T23_02735 [Cryobacterium cheniae]
MENTDNVVAATESWRLSAENVIAFAEIAAPVGEGEFAPFSAEGIDDPDGELDARIDRLLSEADIAVDAAGDRGGIDILLGNLEVTSVLLTASQEPSVVFTEMGVDDGSISFDEARVQVAVLKGAADGVIEPTPRKLPDSVHGKFDELQNAGGTELVELAKSPTVHAAVVGGWRGIAAVVAEKANEAFEAVKSALSWLKRAAVRIVEWVVNKLRKMMPHSFQTKFDKLVETIPDKLADGAPGIVGELLGALLGRPGVVDAWGALSADQVVELESRLDETTKSQLTRIGFITKGRKTVDKFSIVVAVLDGTVVAPQVKIAALALIVAVVGFVGFQVWDGFHDLERLARA